MEKREDSRRRDMRLVKALVRKDRVQNMPRAWRKPNERIRESREACRERVLPHNRKAENND